MFKTRMDALYINKTNDDLKEFLKKTLLDK